MHSHCHVLNQIKKKHLGGAASCCIMFWHFHLPNNVSPNFDVIKYRIEQKEEHRNMLYISVIAVVSSKM